MIPEPHAVIDLAMADGAPVRVRRHGNASGKRLLVSHGNGFAVDGYFPFWGPLCAEFDVAVFDMRGHGRNAPGDPGHHDHAHMAGDLETICRSVGARFGAKPTIGVFHSMSAQAAMRHAIEIGWRWDALILFDAPNVPAAGHPVRARMVAFEDRLAAWARGRRSRFDDPSQLAADYAGTRAASGWVAGAHELMARAVLRRDGDAWALRCPRALEAAVYVEGKELGLWPCRADFAGPVKLIAADPARPYPAPTALSNRALAAEGNFDYAAIPGAGHLLQLEQPAACIAAMLAFLRPLGLT